MSDAPSEAAIDLAMRCITHCVLSRASDDKKAGDIRAAIVVLFGLEVDAEIQHRMLNPEREP